MYLSLSIILALAGPLSAGMEVMGNRYIPHAVSNNDRFQFFIAYESSSSGVDMIIYTTSGLGKIKIGILNEVSIQTTQWHRRQSSKLLARNNCCLSRPKWPKALNLGSCSMVAAWLHMKCLYFVLAER